MKKTMILFAALALCAAAFADTIKQTTDSDFYGGSLNAISVVNTGADAYLALRSSLQQLPGNTFAITGGTDHPLYNMADRLSFPFSAPKRMTVTAIILFGYWEGNAALYSCGLRGDGDASGTSPNAVSWLAPGNYNAMWGQLGSGQQYYFRVTLSADAYINSFTPYHIYIASMSGVDNMNYLRPHGVSPNNGFYASGHGADPFQMVMHSINNGAAWSQYLGSQPVFMLEYLDPAGAYLDSMGRAVSYMGNPYNTYQDRNVYGNNYAGQEFNISTDTTLNKVRIYLSSGAAQPADDLIVVVQDITDLLNITLVTEELFIPKADIFPGFSWQSRTLLSPKNLLAGHKYRVFFKSQGSNSSGYYIIRGVSVHRNASQDTVFAENRLASCTFGGREAYMVYTTGAGTSWDDYNRTQDILIMMSDSVSTVYDASGLYVSPSFDTKQGSEFTGISWLPVSQTAQAGIDPVLFQVAANNDNATWNFIGPDGTASSWYSDPYNSILPGGLKNKRYVKFKMMLSTENTYVSPYIDEVTLEYSGRPDAAGGIKLTNYPNPFASGSENTGIRYTLTADSDVVITILTPFSGVVKKIEIAACAEGGRGAAGGYDNTVLWDGRNGEGMAVESGVYICMVEIKSENRVYKRKIAVLR